MSGASQYMNANVQVTSTFYRVTIDDQLGSAMNYSGTNGIQLYSPEQNTTTFVVEAWSQFYSTSVMQSPVLTGRFTLLWPALHSPFINMELPAVSDSQRSVVTPTSFKQFIGYTDVDQIKVMGFVRVGHVEPLRLNFAFTHSADMEFVCSITQFGLSAMEWLETVNSSTCLTSHPWAFSYGNRTGCCAIEATVEGECLSHAVKCPGTNPCRDMPLHIDLDPLENTIRIRTKEKVPCDQAVELGSSSDGVLFVVETAAFFRDTLISSDTRRSILQIRWPSLTPLEITPVVTDHVLEGARSSSPEHLTVSINSAHCAVHSQTCCPDQSGVERVCDPEIWFSVEPDLSPLVDDHNMNGVDYFDFIDRDRDGWISFEEFHAEFWEEQQCNRTLQDWSNFSTHVALVSNKVSRVQWPSLLQSTESRLDPSMLRFRYNSSVQLMAVHTPQYVTFKTVRSALGWVQPSLWAGTGVQATTMSQTDYKMEWPRLDRPHATSCTFIGQGEVNLTSDNGAQTEYQVKLVANLLSSSTNLTLYTEPITLSWNDACSDSNGYCTYVLSARSVRTGWTTSEMFVKQCTVQQATAEAVVYLLTTGYIVENQFVPESQESQLTAATEQRIVASVIQLSFTTATAGAQIQYIILNNSDSGEMQPATNLTISDFAWSTGSAFPDLVNADESLWTDFDGTPIILDQPLFYTIGARATGSNLQGKF